MASRNHVMTSGPPPHNSFSTSSSWIQANYILVSSVGWEQSTLSLSSNRNKNIPFFYV